MEETLYRMYDRQGRLLYVGRARNFGQRLAQHYKTKFWIPQVAEIRLEQFAFNEIAEAESRAIRDEDPIFNKQGRKWQESEARQAWLNEGAGA